VPKRSGLLIIVVTVVAILIVTAISVLTNSMAPRWDMAYYVDMARNGLVGNQHLAAPFAYRPGAPAIIHAVARILGIDAGAVFRFCAHIMCVVFLVGSFYFVRALGASSGTAALAALALGLNFQILKWTLFAGTMVDIYAYPLILLAFWLMLKRRFYSCLLVSAIGLFFKEFLLLPLLTQAAALVVTKRAKHEENEAASIGERWPTGWITPVSITLLALLICFVLPRLLIHVVKTFQDIDPLNQPSTLRRLYLYPASLRRDFNIVFAYLSWWLPTLVLLDRKRIPLIWNSLRPYRLICGLYLAFHFLLVMYGGTNLDIFATYSLPIQFMVLAVLLDNGAVQLWEKILMVSTVILFNRLWMQIPLPDLDLHRYLNFYGGFHMMVTRRSLFRMAELLAYVGCFWALRALIFRRHPSGVLVTEGVCDNLSSRDQRERF
jgi:hypothetical protein